MRICNEQADITLNLFSMVVPNCLTSALNGLYHALSELSISGMCKPAIPEMTALIRPSRKLLGKLEIDIVVVQ